MSKRTTTTGLYLALNSYPVSFHTTRASHSLLFFGKVICALAGRRPPRRSALSLLSFRTPFRETICMLYVTTKHSPVLPTRDVFLCASPKERATTTRALASRTTAQHATQHTRPGRTDRQTTTRQTAN